MAKPLYIAASFTAGALLLSFFSVFQKAVLGVNPFAPIGFVVPVLFGGTTFALIGFYIHRIKELNAALSKRVERLEGLLPICARCKKIRLEGGDPDDPDSWVPVETYLSRKTDVELTHGLCPACAEEIIRENMSPESRREE